MKLLKFSYATLIIMLLFTSCGKGKEAQKRLDEARAMYENNEFIATKNAIDSINILYPREIEVRKQALTLIRQIGRASCRERV